MSKRTVGMIKSLGVYFPWMGVMVLTLVLTITILRIPDYILLVFAVIFSGGAYLTARRYRRASSELEAYLEFLFARLVCVAATLWLLPVIYYFASFR